MGLSISNLGLWAGLLVDFEGAATRLGTMLPILDALLPVLALAGACGGLVWAAFAMADWIPSLLPSGRLRAYVPLIEELRTASEEALLDGNKITRVNNLIVEAKQILENQFSITCPGVLSHRSFNEIDAVSNWLSEWGTFTSILLPRMRRGDLKKARESDFYLHIKLSYMS